MLSCISNCHLSDSAWSQAVLPIRWGSLRVRSISSLAGSAFLSSLSTSMPLVTLLVSPQFRDPLVRITGRAESVWKRLSGSPDVPVPRPTSQRGWDEVICEKSFLVHLDGLVGSERAVLLAARSSQSGC